MFFASFEYWILDHTGSHTGRLTSVLLCIIRPTCFGRSSQQPLHKCLDQKTWEWIKVADVFVRQVWVPKNWRFPTIVNPVAMLRNHIDILETPHSATEVGTQNEPKQGMRCFLIMWLFLTHTHWINYELPIATSYILFVVGTVGQKSLNLFISWAVRSRGTSLELIPWAELRHRNVGAWLVPPISTVPKTCFRSKFPCVDCNEHLPVHDRPVWINSIHSQPPFLNYCWPCLTIMIHWFVTFCSHQ